MSNPEPQGPEPAESRNDDGKERFSRRDLAKVGGTAVAVVGGLTAVLTGGEEIFEFFQRQYKRINPDPTPTPAPTPTPTPRPLRKATVHHAQPGARDVSLARVAELADRPVENYSADRLAWLGLLLDYRVEFQGLDDERCTVHWSLLNESNAFVDDPYWTTFNALAWPNEAWDPEVTESDVQDGDAWIPYIGSGIYRVVLSVRDSRKQQLAEFTSDPFEMPGRGG